ncbi:MAG: DUF3301 domain-containing protein [Rhodanobacteraceae bacterium]
MPEYLLPLLILLAIVAIWHAALGAREQAREHATRLCGSARLQLLDQTVSLKRLTLGHRPGQGWQIQRDYGFEVSSNGQDRLPGSLRMAGNRLLSWSLPSTGDARALT